MQFMKGGPKLEAEFRCLWPTLPPTHRGWGPFHHYAMACLEHTQHIGRCPFLWGRLQEWRLLRCLLPAACEVSGSCGEMLVNPVRVAHTLLILNPDEWKCAWITGIPNPAQTVLHS